MQRLAALPFLFLAATSAPLAQDHPTFGQVVDTKEDSALSYDCVLREPVLHCQFGQGRVSKQTPKTPRELDAEAGQMISSVTDENCKTIRDVRDQLAVEPPNLPSPLTGQALAELRDLMTSYSDFCDTRSAVTARALVGAVEEKAQRTCTFSVYLFELDFSWSYQTERWETVSQPNGTCGVVTVAFMEPDKTTGGGVTFWNYGQKKIVTNRTGDDPLMGSCSDYPESELRSTWQGRDLNPQCDYVKFNPF
jgi:hypothetical protein